ncbi:LLM class flavin-dependent oxidoreductase [Micromonospora sp. LOL_023]|uniref:LLM class flavin-dependent oxidoreductase n=1 Tax=Micromonospora sp. LOL_023 TaxID=3345418 RepID=UPI003A84FCB5
MDASQVEDGIDSFGDRPRDGRGEIVSHAQAIRAAVAEAVLADQIGIEVVALGERHRPEYAISSPESVLAGIATVTERIRLASGVTVLSSDDPVRVFQRFATVDALYPERMSRPPSCEHSPQPGRLPVREALRTASART